MSASETTTPTPGSALNTRRTGSSLPPMPSGWISSVGFDGGQRRADLEHVRAEDPLRAGRQVVGVVLHERRATGQARAHHLGGADEDRGLPVALGAEAVAVGHEPLHGEPGQLAQVAEVLEVRREGLARPATRAGCAARSPAGRRSAATRAGRRRRAAPGRRRTGPRTRRRARRRRRRRPRPRPRPGRSRPTCSPRRRTAARPRSCRPRSPRRCACCRRTAPASARASRPSRRTRAPRCRSTRSTAGFDTCPATVLRAAPEPGRDVPELAVAVRGLVEVHEVEVDGVPRQLDVRLRVQVQQRGAQRVEAGDPHLGRARTCASTRSRR